ncbi:hypothetical protein FRB99_000673 [Tulasnella sp. 403]|nr:hypothetical protein FRB99_000673 [Tulasnella sp. 403]
MQDLNRRVKDSRDDDFDTIRSQKDEIKLLKGNFEELLFSLVPESTVYQVPALLPLQQLVRTIPGLTKRLSEFCANVEGEDYALGVEIMLERPKKLVEVEPTKKKEKRPALNTDDIYDVGI